MSSKSNYTKQLTDSLNDLRKQNELCDVTIHVSTKSFPAHRAVLAAASSYFKTMFTSGFKERTDKEVKIAGDPDIFEELLNYAYTGRMKIRSKTAYCLLEMACYLQFTDICQNCPKFIHLISSLKITNMLKMFELASSHEYLGMKTLASHIMEHICSYVQELESPDEFLKTADVSFLKHFLSQDNLSSEENVLEMVISWLKCDLETRLPHAVCLLEKVRLGLVPEDRLKELMDGKIMEITECQQLLQKVVQERRSNDSPTVRTMNAPALFAKRGTITAPISLVGPSRWQSEDSFIFKYFDFDEKKWKEMPDFSKPPYQTSLFVANDTLYAIGAIIPYDRFEQSGDPDILGRQCFMYDALYNQWSDLPSMETADSYAQSVFTNGFIYQISSQYGSEQVERFDVTEERWEMSTSLPEQFPADGTHPSSINYHDNIIVYSEKKDTPGTRMLQSFNPKLNIWQTVMLEEVEFDQSNRIHPTLFRHAGSIYRILYKASEGGRFGSEPVVNVLEVQLEENMLTQVSIGQEVKQHMIPATTVGAFRIQEQVFVNVNRCVLLTRVKIKPNQFEDVPRELLELFEVNPSFEDNRLGSSNIVNFTFKKEFCINNESEEHGIGSDSDEVDSDESSDDDDGDDNDDDDEAGGSEDNEKDDDNK